ncbi:hypothetical protein Ahy_B10g105790 isoform B [Arachis hypogaea]|uniref:Uncharacterized protein n=1 Tax=Arachis hypogaea TaxID=3818 RepID=A0A444X8Y1_ARAHY|nr:hypothetical protein Ahy_B10g105790 isoform B [Arachis hypogaea]
MQQRSTMHPHVDYLQCHESQYLSRGGLVTSLNIRLKDMENGNTSSSGIARTKSDQLLMMESATAANSIKSSPESGGGGNLSRKSSRRMTHIRKSRSAQMKIEVDEVSSGAALSRASSASLGLSFSFTGFTLPPDDEISDYKPFSDDDDIPEDIEAGTHKPKFQMDLTLPIYLKGTIIEASLYQSLINATNKLAI